MACSSGGAMSENWHRVAEAAEIPDGRLRSFRAGGQRVEFVPVPHPPGINLGFWRSVGHSMYDFFLECFLVE